MALLPGLDLPSSRAAGGVIPKNRIEDSLLVADEAVRSVIRMDLGLLAVVHKRNKPYRNDDSGR